MTASTHQRGDQPYRQLVEGLVDYALYLLDVDGTVKTWNPGAQRIVGYCAEEIIGSNFSVFYTDEDIRAGEPARALEIARSTGSYQSEGWRIRKDGTRLWASIVIDALRNPAAEVVGFAKVTRDMTQTHAERAALEEQREKSRLFIEAAPNGMLIVEDSGIITLANSHVEAIFGYPPGGLLNRSVDMLVPRTMRAGPPAKPESCADEALPRATADRRQLEGRRLDGSAVPIEIMLNPVETASGRVVVASVIEITERVTAQEQLRLTASEISEQYQLMKMAEEMAHYGHWRIDLMSDDVYWSDEVRRIRGVPLTYKPTLEAGIAAHDRSGPKVAEIIRQASIDGKPLAYESRILRPDESFRDVLCMGRGDFAADGALVALVGIFQDITERKDAERARDQLTQRVTLATETGKVGIWEWVIDTGAMTWLGHMFTLYGLDASSALPSYALWKSALHENDREFAGRAIDDALTGREAFDTEFRVVWPNAEVHNIRAQGTVLRDAAGEPVRMVGINWDITEVRSLADQIREEQERLQASERERLYEHERRWSRTFQRAVLPLTLPDVRGCTFDAVYEPGLRDAQVGGDWYDAIQLQDGRVLVSIGDVSGSGLQAAVVVGVARQIIRGISQLHASPILILDAADRALCLEYPGVYVSAWVGLIDLVTRTITYASAGHPPPLLVSKDGAVHELADPTSMLIGLRKGHRGQPSTVKIIQGDALVLYTDGITEAGRDVVAGTRSLCEAASAFAATATLNPAASIKRQVIPGGSADDVALLVVRTNALEAERCIDRWRFDVGDGNAAGFARGKFVNSLKMRGFTADACANAELVFGELIGNVVRHANHEGDVDVAVNHGGPDTVLHVMDHGAGFTHTSRLPRDPYAEHGRGLFLIAALTEDFTVSERPDGGSHARVVLLRNAA